MARRSVASSVEGTELGDLNLVDWGQLALSAGIFGSAFLWIALALRSIDPGTIAFGRAGLGVLALVVLKDARGYIARVDWPRLVVAGFFGVAAPVWLFALAEERITSALAGMLVSTIPTFTAIVAALATRSWPRPFRLLGLATGMVGMVLLAGPDLADAGGEAVGVLMVLAAVLCYAIASAVYAPLQQTYGALRVTLWVLVVSTAMLAPAGLYGLARSSFDWLPVVALLILGVIGTGIVWALLVSLIGRVGAVRASIVGYLIPIVALVLGVVFLDEKVQLIQVIGVLVALTGGYVLSRGED